MSLPDPSLRPQIQAFYAAIRDNNVERLEEFSKSQFPLAWAQAFSETSLPEYAMRHGSVEAAWWLMAHGAMPEKWSAFSGDVWKTFLKKGLALALSKQGPSIPMDVYKNILKVAFKTTGEKIPSWLDQYTATASTFAGSLLNRVSQGLDRFARSGAAPAPEAKNDVVEPQEQEVEDAAPPKVSASRIRQASPARKTASKSASKTTTKSRPRSSK